MLLAGQYWQGPSISSVGHVSPAPLHIGPYLSHDKVGHVPDPPSLSPPAPHAPPRIAQWWDDMEILGLQPREYVALQVGRCGGGTRLRSCCLVPTNSAVHPAFRPCACHTSCGSILPTLRGNDPP